MSDIEIFDGQLRLLVPSETNPDDMYLCDLRAWKCSCMHHSTRLYPRYRDEKATREETACKHLARAVNYHGGAEKVAIMVEQEERYEELCSRNNIVIGGHRVSDDS